MLEKQNNSNENNLKTKEKEIFQKTKEKEIFQKTKEKEIFQETKEETKKLKEEVLYKKAEELEKIFSDLNRRENILKLLETLNENYDYFNEINYENLSFEIEKFLVKNNEKFSRISEKINLSNYDPERKIKDLKNIFRIENSIVYKLLNKKDFTKQDIIKIFLVENLFFHFSTKERIKEILSENGKKEFEKDERNFIKIFEKEGIQIFFGGINTEEDIKEAYLIDNDFKSFETNIEDYLPMKNQNISILFQNIEEKDKKVKVHFLKERKQNLLGTIKKGNILIFRKNIKKSYPDASEEDLKLFEKEIITNESIHDLLKKIGFISNFKTYDIESFHDLSTGKKRNINNSYIHEILSDYGSFSGEKVSKIGYERIISVSIFGNFYNETKKNNYANNSYVYTEFFHKNIIEKILGKKISNYEKYKIVLDHIKIYKEKTEGKKDSNEIFKIYQEESNNLQTKIQPLVKEIYNDLKEKQIDYNGKKINGLEYLKIMNQKQGEIILEEVYKWYKKQKN